MSGRLCKSKTKAGDSCKGYAITNSLYCAFHDPAIAIERQIWRKLGGQRRKISEIAEIKLSTIEDIHNILHAIIASTLSLLNSIERNRTLNAMVRTALQVYQVGDLEQRMQSLEERWGEVQSEIETLENRRSYLRY